MADIVLQITGGIGPAGVGVPAGGTAGQVLEKIDGTNYNTRWATGGGGVSLGETSTTAYRGDRGKTAYDHSQITTGNPHNVTKSDVGLGNVPNVDATNPANIAQDSTHRFVTDTEKALWNSGGGFASASFTNVLTLAANVVMPQTQISSALAFSVSGTPVLMTVTYVRLVADGTNVPTFTGMVQWGGSMDWDNTAGIVNSVAFFNDGSQTYYSIAQVVGASPIPMPPGVTVVTVGTPGSTSMPLTWTLPGGGTPTDYNIRYKLHSEPTTWTTWSHAPSTVRSATITGLSSSTQYDFEVAATNSAGTADWSTLVSGTTAAPVAAPDAPTLNTATGGSQLVSLAWTAAGTGGPVTNYSVRYKLTSEPTVWTTWGSTFSGTTGDITGLADATQYDFEVAANGTGGTSAWSNLVIGTTSAGANIHPQLTILNRMVESGNGSTGYIYTGQGAGDYGCYAVTGAYSMVGDFTIKIPVISAAMVGINTTGTGGAFGTTSMVIYASDGGSIKMVRNGTGNATPNVIADTPNNTVSFMRLRRTGTTLYGEVSTDDVNWTVVDQTNSYGTATVYPWLGAQGAGVVAGPLTVTGGA